MFDKKIAERRLLLQRAFSRSKLFNIGKSLKISYFQDLLSEWDINEDKAALEIASSITDEQLEQLATNYKPRKWEIFKGQYYTLENGELSCESGWRKIRVAISQIQNKYDKHCVAILKFLINCSKACSTEEIKQVLPEEVDPLRILHDLEKLGVVATSYKGKDYQEWVILEETTPLIRLELGLTHQEAETRTTGSRTQAKDPITEENIKIRKMDQELNSYLNDLIKYRIDETLAFGKFFSISHLSDYLESLFGPVLYFDSLLSITQQYGLADVEIIHAQGRTGMRTGWNLSLFGEPGTGKSFSIRDLILGKPDAKIPPHGIPGRNRYAGGITPARFIRLGQAYSRRIFNFIVPEFNDWFKYKGMVEPLKLAMERSEIKYETQREIIGPYHFRSFFSVNYNVATVGKSYEVTVQDPNFNAIEDRMLCRLHRLTKQRYIEIAESQMRLAFGEIDIEKEAQKFRDHLTLVHAAEINHPSMKGRFPSKPIMLTKKAQTILMKARDAILREIPREVVHFSARLEDRAIRFASAASLLDFFQSNNNYIPVNEEALNYAIQLYVEEASTRSREEFDPDTVLGKLGLI